MDFFRNLFGKPPYPRELKPEVDRLVEELIRIGKTEDYLSERPGGSFNGQCHNIRARQIGKRLFEIGGQPLMQMAHKQVRKKLGLQISSHLEYAWNEIGGWIP
jgi:hypothetical protein